MDAVPLGSTCKFLNTLEESFFDHHALLSSSLYNSSRFEFMEGKNGVNVSRKKG